MSCDGTTTRLMLLQLALLCSACSSPSRECATDDECPGTQMCVDGMCVDVESDAAVSCAIGHVECGGACVDTRIDPDHCGRCDNACASTERCFFSACESICSTGSIACGEVCVDPRWDPANCGRCDHACADGEVCDRGVCASECGSGQSYCAGRCTLTQDDPQNCGACGSICAPGRVCTAGMCVPSPYGDGSDGPMTVDVDQTINERVGPLTASVTAGGNELLVDDPAGNFAAGQLVFIHQTKTVVGPAGNWELARLATVMASATDTIATLVLEDPLALDYVVESEWDRAQVVVVPELTTVHLTSGELTAPAWNGTVGGILAIVASERIVIEPQAQIQMSSKGFRGEQAGFHSVRAGEGFYDYDPLFLEHDALANGGETATDDGCLVVGGTPGVPYENAGGGGHATPGGGGGCSLGTSWDGTVAAGGNVPPGLSEPMTHVFFGGGGGGAGSQPDNAPGGAGGGIIFLASPRIDVLGELVSDGGVGEDYSLPDHGRSGGGAGGAIYLRTRLANLGAGIRANGGDNGGVGFVVVFGPAEVHGDATPSYFYEVR